MTEAIYTEVSVKVETAKVTGRRVSTSGMLKFLGVSRSGYRAFLNRKLSPSKLRKAAVKEEIQRIYDDSKQNYGAPKITKELRKSGEIISERTVGKYMREMGIKAQWVKPWTTTTRDSDLSQSCTTFLMSNSIQIAPMPCGVRILPTFGPRTVLFTSTVSWTYLPGRLLPGLYPIQWMFPPLLQQLIKQRLLGLLISP